MNYSIDRPISQDGLGEDDNKDLMRFLSKILANWYWFLISILFFSLVAYLYVRYQTPVFVVSARVLINDEKKGGATSSEMLDLGSLLGQKSSVDNETEIFKTRYLMEQVVRDLNANVVYYNNGRIRDVELYKSPFTVELVQARDSLLTYSFDVRQLNSKSVELTSEDYTLKVSYDRPFMLQDVGVVVIKRNFDVPYSNSDSYSFTISSLDKKVSEFMERLSVGVTNKQVSIVDLSFKYPVQRKGEDILHALIKTYVEQTLNDRNIVADSTISFIENRLLYVGDELGSIEGSIQKFKQGSKLADISEQSKLLVQTSNDYVKELSEVETQISILNQLEKFLKEGSADKRVLPSAILPQDMVFNSLIERYNQLLLERDRQSLSSTDSNPYVQNLDSQISNLKKDMLSNLGTTRQGLALTKTEILKRSGSLAGQIRQVPNTERVYLDLARQQQIKQELYIYLLQKREETAISKTSNISNSRVIDPPKANPIPVSPRKGMILLLCVAIGAALPLVFFYLKDVLNTKIISKEDILHLTDLSIIGEIGNHQKDETIVVTKESRSPIAEQFRVLRTNLSFYLKHNQKTILLTSSMSGEGKSFVSLNLASILALSGKKVVVMEMDLRKPNLSNKLNISNTFGFTNYIISEEVQPTDIILPSNSNDNLFIIPSGPIPPNPAETILDSKMSQLMEVLKSRFDYIIIDAPPIGLVTDAQLLSDYSDMTIYVVRQGYTFKDQLQIVNDLHQKQKIKNLALLINDIRTSGSYGYGYGYSYSYGYGQGYYVEDSPKAGNSISNFFRNIRK